MSKYAHYVWNGHSVAEEIGNVSDRRAALKRWTATDKRWNKNTVARGPSLPQSNAFQFVPGTPR